MKRLRKNSFKCREKFAGKDDAEGDVHRPGAGGFQIPGPLPPKGDMSMLKKYIYIFFMTVLVFLQGCGVLIFNQNKMAQQKMLIHEEQYKPYKLLNTIEGYKEFIAKYPRNQFVRDAETRIESLEFDPYEKEDSIEGYMEFVIRYPKNPHAFKANAKIEQVEIKRYEKIDSIEGYREFLAKYPESIFAVLAQNRLQELEIRALDRTLQKEHNFDLLRYRLTIRRLKKRLQAVNGINLGNFTFFASIASAGGEKFFHTHLIYPEGVSSMEVSSKETTEIFFDKIFSKLLVYLDNRFKNKDQIDGFSFDVSSSLHRFYGDRKILSEYYFSLDKVGRFAQNKLSKQELLAEARIVFPEKALSVAGRQTPSETFAARGAAPLTKAAGTEKPAEALAASAREKTKSPLLKPPDGSQIMQLVAKRQSGKDSIVSSHWEFGKGSGRRHTMTEIVKKKNYRGKDGFIDKSIVKYIDPPDHYGIAILTWNYTNRGKSFWYGQDQGFYGRIANSESYRPPAESDFSLTDYCEIKVQEEKHVLLRSEIYEDSDCYVVESRPLKTDLIFGKRIRWIVPGHWMPLKTEYYDKKGLLWKILRIEWQSKAGFWFWKKALIDNVQSGYRTAITVEDIRINVGLLDRDFTLFALERLRRH